MKRSLFVSHFVHICNTKGHLKKIAKTTIILLLLNIVYILFGSFEGVILVNLKKSIVDVVAYLFSRVYLIRYFHNKFTQENKLA